MTGRCHVGTSGWTYRWWRGAFYPQGLCQGDWLAHYMQVFDTVEINATFYHLPRPELLERWRAIAPDGFLHAVKASPRRIKHLRRLRDCGGELEVFLRAVRRLGPALPPCSTSCRRP